MSHVPNILPGPASVHLHPQHSLNLSLPPGWWGCSLKHAHCGFIWCVCVCMCVALKEPLNKRAGRCVGRRSVRPHGEKCRCDAHYSLNSLRTGQISRTGQDKEAWSAAAKRRQTLMPPPDAETNNISFKH